ncbi:MAG: hypothetical protein ACRDHW_11560 [Ktedonobacteraceae bacterium]
MELSRTSGNGGKTWQLATPDASNSMTFAQAGNDTSSAWVCTAALMAGKAGARC